MRQGSRQIVLERSAASAAAAAAVIEEVGPPRPAELATLALRALDGCTLELEWRIGKPRRRICGRDGG
eukprot:SAG11_NODE_32762_length_281_cov_0.571429_1_plen_67_part_01